MDSKVIHNGERTTVVTGDMRTCFRNTDADAAAVQIAMLQQDNADLRQEIERLRDCERGMQSLRNVCESWSGTPPEKQSRSSEDIALWADAVIEGLERELAESSADQRPDSVETSET